MGVYGALGSVVFGGLRCSGVCDVQRSLALRGLCCLGSAFFGVCSARGSVVFRGLRCLGGLQCSGVCVARGSALLGGPCCSRLWILALPHIRHPRSLLQSPSPSPPALPAPLSLLQTLPTVPAMSLPGGTLPGTDPGPLLSILLPDLLLPALRVPVPAAGCSTARPAAPWGLPLTSPREGDRIPSVGTRPLVPRPQRGGDKDTNPRAGRSPARASRWNEGGNRDRTRGLVAPAWFAATVL